MVRILRSIAFVALHAAVLSLHAAPPRVLFPNNLHLTRQVEDPIGKSTLTIEEYCAGNRVVSVSADRTVIVDYDRQEVTEIDRRAGTYSVSRFDEVASAALESGAPPKRRVQPTDAAQSEQLWKTTPLGVRGSAAGRSVEHFELVETAQERRIEVGVDRSVTLSREAVAVLIGAAYPNPSRDEHEPILRAAASPAAKGKVATNAPDGEAAYGLPLTQSFTVSDSGTELTFRSVVSRVGSEPVPSDVLLIPPGAKRVESRAAALRRQLRELDEIAPPSSSREN